MKNKKKILILGASELQVPGIYTAINSGLDVLVADYNPAAPGFQIDGVKKINVSTIDTPEILRVSKDEKIDAIMTLATDMPMQTVASVVDELSLPGISRETAIRTTNKNIMREVLSNNLVPIPQYYAVNDFIEFLDAVNKLKKQNLNVIVKPADNSGSRGIMYLESYKSEEIKRIYEYVKSYSKSGTIMVEEYMEGPEVSVETFAINGRVNVIQITDKITSGIPHFVELGHSQPSKLPLEIQEKIKETAITANNVLGIANGPSHTEIKITKDGPKIVEIGARLGGDHISTDLVKLSTGIDLVDATIKSSLGEKVDLIRVKNQGAAILYFDQKKGKIRNLNYIEEAKKIPGIVDIVFNKGIGDIVDEISSSSSRIGYVIAKGKNQDEALRACKEAQRIIEIEID